MGYTIYQHLNKINNKSYIGLTKRSLQARWGACGEYYKQCTKFWKAIQKYGWDSFDHIIIETNISTLAEANEKEQYYIEKFNSIKNGYNISKGGFDKSYCTIEVYQLDSNKTILNKFTSAAEAELLLNIDRGSISKCCKNKAITAGGFSWCYVYEYNNYYIKTKSTKFSREKAVLQLDKNTEQPINEYKSASEAARALANCSNGSSHILKCCNKKRKTAYGYKWRYKDEERKNKN